MSDLHNYDPVPVDSSPEPAQAVRAFLIKFKNAWGETAYIVLAPDAWIAISAAERALTAQHDTSEYPYRMVFAREIEGTVVRTEGLHILDASEVGA